MKSQSPLKQIFSNKLNRISFSKEIINKRKKSNFDKQINILINGDKSHIKKRANSQLFINVNSKSNRDNIKRSINKKENTDFKVKNDIVIHDLLFNNLNSNDKLKNNTDDLNESIKEKEKMNLSSNSFINIKINSENGKNSEYNINKLKLSPIKLSSDSSFGDSKLNNILNINKTDNNKKSNKKSKFFCCF